MVNNCGTCRFYDRGTCTKFPIKVEINYVACKDYANKESINESEIRKFQIND